MVEGKCLFCLQLLQYCYITVLWIHGLTAVLLVQSVVEITLLPAVTAVLLHHCAMDVWTDCSVVSTGCRGNNPSACSYCSTVTSVNNNLSSTLYHNALPHLSRKARKQTIITKCNISTWYQNIRTGMVQLIWCLWLCDRSWLTKVGPTHGVQLNVKRNLHRPNECCKND